MSRGPGRWQRAILRETRPTLNRSRDWVSVRDIWVAVGDAELTAVGVPRWAWPDGGIPFPHPDRERLRYGPIPRADQVSIRRAMLGLVDAGVLEAERFGGVLKVRWPWTEDPGVPLDNLQKLFPGSDLLSGVWDTL